MCRLFKVSRSGYYKYLSKKDILDKDLQLANKIEECQEIHHKTYGYRRVHIWLERQGKEYIEILKPFSELCRNTICYQL